MDGKKPSASTLSARVDIAEYEFSLVLGQVLDVSRRAHFERVFKHDPGLRKFLLEMLSDE